MKPYIQALAVLGLSATLNSCGSKIHGEAALSPRLGIGRSSGEGDAEGGRCAIKDVDAKFAAKGFTKHDINSLMLKTPDNRSKSMCDYLYDYDLQVAIVQFSGVLCLSCQDEAKAFTAKLNNPGPYGNGVGHIVALTDFWEDFTAPEFKNFMTTYSPVSIEAHDPDISMWKYFSANPASPTRPTVVAFNRHGWSFVINTEGSDPMAAFDAAKALEDQAKIDSLDSEREPSPDEYEPVDTIPNNPSPPAGPTPTPSPSNPSKPLTLSGSKNVSLTASSGTKTTLSDYFENNDYLVIDISQYNCTYCRQLANKHQSDSSFQSRMQSGTCKTLTVVPNNDLASWTSAYSTNTFVGKTSKGVSSLSSVASAFGVSFSGTPTVFMIDRTGKLVAQEVGAMPSQVNTLCK